MRAEAAPSFLWVEAVPPPGSALALGDGDAHYLTRVCRARPGEGVTLTDGRGTRARGRMAGTRERVAVEVEAVQRFEAARGARVLCGCPERGRADWMVEKLAELGVSTFQPVDCERGRWPAAETRPDRWRRLAIAALRQSRGLFLMDLLPVVPLPEAIAGLPADGGRYLADPDGTTGAGVVAPALGDAVGLVGPAGGLSGAELALALAGGFAPMALSCSRLRTETAAIAWAGWWSAGGISGAGRSDAAKA